MSHISNGSLLRLDSLHSSITHIRIQLDGAKRVNADQQAEIGRLEANLAFQEEALRVFLVQEQFKSKRDSRQAARPAQKKAPPRPG